MCKRLDQNLDPAHLKDLFNLTETPAHEPRGDITPGSRLATVRDTGDRRELVSLHWGLIPPWAKSAKAGLTTFNARCESVADKPSFASAFRSRRCLVPADAFYEWEKCGKKRRLWLIRRKNGTPLALAGLWECWEQEGAEPIESCTIITCPANRLVSAIHHRMPVILEQQNWDAWLDPASTAPVAALQPVPGDILEMLPLESTVHCAKAGERHCQQKHREGQLELF